MCTLRIQLTRTLLLFAVKVQEDLDRCGACVQMCECRYLCTCVCVCERSESSGCGANIHVIHHYPCQCVCLTRAHLSPQPLGTGVSNQGGVRGGLNMQVCVTCGASMYFFLVHLSVFIWYKISQAYRDDGKCMFCLGSYLLEVKLDKKEK